VPFAPTLYLTGIMAKKKGTLPSIWSRRLLHPAGAAAVNVNVKITIIPAKSVQKRALADCGISKTNETKYICWVILIDLSTRLFGITTRCRN
jgi:hypothetical protein